jgi:hypothetical protein
VLTESADSDTKVSDRGLDGAPQPPIPAELRVGIDSLGLPFSEHSSSR